MPSHVLRRRTLLACLALAATEAGAASKRRQAPPADTADRAERLNAAAERPVARERCARRRGVVDVRA
jgi:hypothetical protein